MKNGTIKNEYGKDIHVHGAPLPKDAIRENVPIDDEITRLEYHKYISIAIDKKKKKKETSDGV